MRGDGKWGSSLVHKNKFIESLSYTNAPIKPQNRQFFKKEKKRKGKTHPQYYLQKCKEYEKESRDWIKKNKKKIREQPPTILPAEMHRISRESRDYEFSKKKKKRALVLTYVFSWRMKLEKLQCLKYFGRRLVESWWESQTMKLLRAWLHETIESVAGSSTMSNVFVRKGGGPESCNPSIGWGEEIEDELPPISSSSSFTLTTSMAFSYNR